MIGLNRASEGCLIENSHGPNLGEVGPKENNPLRLRRVNFGAKSPSHRLIRFERKAREVDELGLYLMYQRVHFDIDRRLRRAAEEGFAALDRDSQRRPNALYQLKMLPYTASSSRLSSSAITPRASARSARGPKMSNCAPGAPGHRRSPAPASSSFRRLAPGRFDHLADGLVHIDRIVLPGGP